jgi:hypothetical protein
VVRCFDDENVVHVSGSVDPVRDVEIIDTELLLKDLETVERRVERTRKPAKTGDKEAQKQLAFYERLAAHLADGHAARAFEVEDHEQPWMHELFLLTRKPVLYAANVSEDEVAEGNAYVEQVRALAQGQDARVVVVSAEIEAQLVEMEPDDRALFLDEMGLERSGLERLIQAAYDLLGLITYFTAGPKEARAWTITRGTKAPQAAGKIHTDFERGFIRAETIHFDDYVKHGSEAAARDAGVMRTEGKTYVVKDGDVMLFRFNV